jgi:hypothetical protein
MRQPIQLFGLAVMATALAAQSRLNPGVEQTAEGTQPAAALVAGFDGLGVGFEGPQGSASLRSPSDNSLAVGPNHIVQTVNSRMAIFSKRGARFNETGRVLYGPVNTNNVFRNFGDPPSPVGLRRASTCESRNNGDAVVRYDQLAHRWLIVMPIFSRAAERPDQPPVWSARAEPYPSPVGVAGQPGKPEPLFQPPRPATEPAPPSPLQGTQLKPVPQNGPYSMCYAISTSDDPMGPYYRYEFLRPLFPDYPRPAVWPDGYYVPTSTGDDVIEKHACVVERHAMIAGRPAREQCFIINDVNFLNNADLDGTQLPPGGAPNVMMAAGGTQLKNVFEDDAILTWKMFTNWEPSTSPRPGDPPKSRLEGPERIPVAPYHYLCNGQLTNCVPQPGAERHLDAQGDKIMARVVYRRIGNQQSIVGVHSVDTAAKGGGVRWYEFRIDAAGKLTLHQQGTYAPQQPGNQPPSFRWMASPAIDKLGNIGIGYSFGDALNFVGQRFAARRASDPPGLLTLRESVLVQGEAAQASTLRWQDYTQTAIDPSDDCTIWYVGDYLKKDATSYSTRIGAYRLPGCSP